MENNLFRPVKLSEFFGQSNITENLKIFIYSAKKRKTVLDHMIFYGPPGLGKTSLAYIIAEEMSSKIMVINASSLEKISDLVSILSILEEGSILFIDEIHRMNKEIEETLYSVMEDFVLNIAYKNDENTKALSVKISPFTLIGATTMQNLISTPLMNRFGIAFKFNYYSISSLKEIIINNASKINLNITKKACNLIAERSRYTPRISNNILKRVFDYKIYKNIDIIDENNIIDAFNVLNIFEYGLNEFDIRILKIMYKKFRYTPVSIEVISSILNEDANNIKFVNEPFLVNSNFIERTKRGRVLTKKSILFLEKNQINEY
ncbi:MAG: Holliday junction branch migration DNA helicase RuvB [Bacilli bacterium]